MRTADCLAACFRASPPPPPPPARGPPGGRRPYRGPDAGRRGAGAGGEGRVGGHAPLGPVAPHRLLPPDGGYRQRRPRDRRSQQAGRTVAIAVLPLLDSPSWLHARAPGGPLGGCGAAGAGGPGGRTGATRLSVTR